MSYFFWCYSRVKQLASEELRMRLPKAFRQLYQTEKENYRAYIVIRFALFVIFFLLLLKPSVISVFRVQPTLYQQYCSL